ncbi:putative gibberellin 20 oxidase [Stachybotrys elegans]|uniref:Gibberellin 20 oxidase n=1 Tax=Stachybotrys elegans TaxID=80388 RepID=A0A8K0SEU8_9HYPO|nr:putative gibberellin 20 oxidase [Stachybotrys elegans]
MEIPVIDVSGFFAGTETDKQRIAKELHAACCAPGFFQITGHTIPSELRQRLLSVLPSFFALPSEKKAALHRSNSKCLRGYEQVGAQKLEKPFADQKEGFMIGHELPEDSDYLRGPNQWPDDADVPSFRAIFTEYFAAVHALSISLFRMIALSLELPENYFDDFVSSEQSIAMCRAHRYPPTTPEKAERSRGIGAHTDFGALTLLLQDDLGGLEVYHRPSEAWIPVKPIKDAYVVNIGDMLERWTNQKYTSTLHRVISPVSREDRYSVAFFNEGLASQIIQCIPTCLKEGEKPLFPPITAEEHLRSRYGSSY